jgi:AcrR family transcriptional regulator
MREISEAPVASATAAVDSAEYGGHAVEPPRQPAGYERGGLEGSPSSPPARRHTDQRREIAKERRRQIILEAARDLIKESGETGLSMRALAERASVSTATPYNLFGSKQGVLGALLDADLRRYQRRLRRTDGDEIELLFAAVSVARDFFDREPEFYRAVLGALYVAGADYRGLFGAPRIALWCWLVQRAIDAGRLPGFLKAEAFAINLLTIFVASIMEWVSGHIDLEAMELRTHYGIALALLGLADPPLRARLEARVHALQERLA